MHCHTQVSLSVLSKCKLTVITFFFLTKQLSSQFVFLKFTRSKSRGYSNTYLYGVILQGFVSKMFFGFNVFDPKNSPAINTHQESYASGFTAAALGQKKASWDSNKYGSKSLAQ